MAKSANRMGQNLAVATIVAVGMAGVIRNGAARPMPQANQVQAEIIPSPAGEYSSQPSLSTGRDGSVLMLWMERPRGGTAMLKFARHDGTRWSDAHTVTSGRGLVASAADIPSLLELPGGRLVAHWQQVSASNSRSYGVRISQSTDGGSTWSTPVIPHATHETGENGFVSLYAATGDSAGVIWLDGRNFTGPSAGRAETMLATARVSASGTVGAERVLDQRVCDCCHTSFAPTASGGILVYRDRDQAEVRDIAHMRLRNGAWTTTAPVHVDNWVTPACPVNGPSVAAAGEQAAVAWFTHARDTSKVLVSFSAGAGQPFSTPLRIDAGDPLGRVRIVMTQPGVAWALWMERMEGYNSQLRLRRISSQGTMSTAHVLAAPNLTHTTGFPQMAVRRGEVFLAWTTAAETGAPPAVRVARVRVGDR